jgi:PAS domain S-box-containing protein
MSRNDVESTLLDSAGALRALLDSLPVPVQGYGPDGVVIYWNRASERLYGYTVAEAIGRDLAELVIPPALRPHFQTALAAATDLTESGEFLPAGEIELVDKRGRPVHVHSTHTAICRPGRSPLLFCLDLDLAERQRAEEALRRERSLLQSVMETTDAMLVLLDLEFNFVWVNPAYATGCRLKPEQLVGRNHFQLYPHAENEAIFLQVRDTGEAVCVKDKPFEFPDQPDRGVTYWDWSLTPTRDDHGAVSGLVFSLRETTAFKRAEEALRASEEQYRVLVEAANDGIALHPLGHDRATSRFVRCNSVLCRMLGYTETELAALSPYDIQGPESLPQVAGEAEALRTGRGLLFEKVLIGKDGRRVPAEINSRVFELNGRSMVLSVIRDVSERERLQAERQALEAKLLQTQKLESLGILAGGIAHDFNNILLAILGNADLALLDLSPVSPVRPMLDDIVRASRRAADLCQQMLAYSGKGRFVVRPLDLNELVREMSNMLEVSVTKMADLHLDLTPALPQIEADATQVRQVVMNLIINASEALGGKNGGIRLSTGVLQGDPRDLPNVQLADDLPAGRYVSLEITDTGHGMDHATMERIFDPFFTTKFTGRGLGLAAVLGIVRSHRGAIAVTSEVDRGTTFRVVFPVAAKAAEAVTANGTEPAPAWSGRPVVLLVDDEAEVRSVGERMLRRLGCEVLLAVDGDEGLRLYRENRGRVDVVLMDLMMPCLDGVQAAAEIWQLDPQQRVIVCSGFNEQEIDQRFAGLPLAGFVHKPFDYAGMRAALAGALRTRPDSTR